MVDRAPTAVHMAYDMPTLIVFMPRDMNIRLMNIAERNTTYQKALLSVFPPAFVIAMTQTGSRRPPAKEEKSAHGYASLWKWF